MSAITPTDKLNILFNKYLGYADISGTTFATRWTENASETTYSNNIYFKKIPDNAPSILLSQNITVQYKKAPSLNSTTLTYIKEYSSNPEQSHIVKYKDVQLYGFEGNPDIAFYYNDLSGNPNLLKGAITDKHTRDPSYAITVKRQDGTYVAYDEYILDSDAGIIVFYNTAGISRTDPPKITFWRYEGPVGLGYDASNVYLGTNAALINQQPNSIAIGTNAGRDTQGSNAIAIGTNAGYTSQHANSIILNASDASLNSLTPGFFINPIREIDTTAATVTPISYYNPVTKEVQYGTNTWYATAAKSAIDMSGNQILKLAEPTDPSGATTKSYVDTAISNITTYLADPSTAWYNIRAGTNVDLSANRIINLADPSGNSDAVTKNYVDTAVYNTEVHIGRYYNSQLGGITLPYDSTTSQGYYAIGIGYNAGSNGQQQDTVAIGRNAGRLNQTTYAIALGLSAGSNIQGSNAIAIGQSAGLTSQNSNAIAIGQSAGRTRQNINAIAIGQDAGWTDQSGNAIAFGQSAGRTRQNINAIAIGQNAGNTDQSGNAIAIGQDAGRTSQNINAIAIGQQAGFSNQSQNTIAIGQYAGNTRQNINAIAIGQSAGWVDQSGNAIAIGNNAALSSQSSNAIAIGQSAGNTRQNINAIAIGQQAGNTDQSGNAIAIGRTAGNYRQNVNAIAIGQNAGFSDQSGNAIAIGQSAGNTRQNVNAIAIGQNAGLTDQSGNAIAIGNNAATNSQNQFAIAIGKDAAVISQGSNSISMGQNAGWNSQQSDAIAIGQQAGYNSQKTIAIAIGKQAGFQFQGQNSIAIGENAGYNSQGIYSVAIGANAGKSLQGSNCIILNAAGKELNTDTSGLFIDPIRQASNSSVILTYNTFTKEIQYANNTIQNPLQSNLDMSGNKIIRLAEPIDPSGAATKYYVDASYNSLKSYVDSSLNNITTYIDTRIGSSITSVQNWSTIKATTTPDLSNNRITNVADPSNNQDVATKNYVDTKVNPLDQWLNTYLLSQPPAIDISTNFTSTSSEIGFSWTLPQQISVAFSTQKFPVINELYADISGVAPVFTPPTTTQYVPGTSNPVTLLILSKSTGDSGYQTRTIGGITYNAYVYYNSSLSTAGSTIYVTIYYKNSSSQQPNKVTVPLSTFMQGYPPSIVRTIIVTPSITPPTSATVQWTAPEFIDTTPGNQKAYGTAGAPGYAVPAYTFTYQPIASSKYGGISGLLSTTNTQNYINNPPLYTQSYEQNNLYAGTSYKVTITAKNDISSTPSPDASGTFTTTLPPNSVAITAYNIPFTGHYNRSSTIQNVSNTVLASTDLIFYNAGSTVISSSPITLAVTNSYNPGSTSATAMTLEYDASNKLTVGGFPSLTPSTQGTIATSITATDMYPTDPLRDKLIASVSLTLQLTLPSPAASQKSSTLTHKINGSIVGTKTYTYYVDSLPTAAQASISGTPTYTTSSLTQKTICGIPIYGTTASQDLSFNNITILNQGKYFYYKDKLFTVSVPLMGINSSIGTLPASPYDASGAIVSPLTYPTTTVSGSFSSSSYSQGMPYIIKPYNINNLSTSLNASVPIIVDGPTANKVFPVSEQNPAGSIAGVEGMRFSNPADLTSTSVALTSFNHSTLLTTNLELLYANGRYRYKETTPTYLINYSTLYGGPDYSGLSGTTRYATFSWTVSNSYASQISNLKFQIQNLKSGMITGINSQTNDIVSSGIELYYKFQEFNGSTPIAITDSSAKTTVWVNAFQVNNNAINASYYQNSSNNQSGGFNLANSTLTDLTNPIIGVNGWSFKPTDILTGNTLKIYVRVGFQDTATDAVFSQINCSYT